MANKYEAMFTLTSNQGDVVTTSVKYHFTFIRLAKHEKG